jgi:hypothetical protein
MQELHRLSVQLLKQELNQIGFQLGSEGDLERVLYPHYLSHPIGIGEFLLLFGFREKGTEQMNDFGNSSSQTYMSRPILRDIPREPQFLFALLGT